MSDEERKDRQLLAEIGEDLIELSKSDNRVIQNVHVSIMGTTCSTCKDYADQIIEVYTIVHER